MKSERCPPADHELADFERDVWRMVKEIKFRKDKCHLNNLQIQMKEDLAKIKKDKYLTIPADKTGKFYRVGIRTYEKLLNDEITSKYRKDNNNTLGKVNRDSAGLSRILELEERTNVIVPVDSFLSLKEKLEAQYYFCLRNTSRIQMNYINCLTGIL